MEVIGLMGEGASKQEGSGEMRKRRAKLEDGRYLIYYTFGNKPPPPTAETERAEPVAEEGRRV